MYTHVNFPTKKSLKQAVAAFNETGENPVTYYQPGPFGSKETQNGSFCVEGPHYPQPHRFYASCKAKDGVIVKVK